MWEHFNGYSVIWIVRCVVLLGLVAATHAKCGTSGFAYHIELTPWYLYDYTNKTYVFGPIYSYTPSTVFHVEP